MGTTCPRQIFILFLFCFFFLFPFPLLVSSRETRPTPPSPLPWMLPRGSCNQFACTSHVSRKAVLLFRSTLGPCPVPSKSLLHNSRASRAGGSAQPSCSPLRMCPDRDVSLRSHARNAMAKAVTYWLFLAGRHAAATWSYRCRSRCRVKATTLTTN